MKKVIALICIYLCNCLPIKKNKIFIFSYYGSQYGCNPKYITEYIINNYPEDKFDIVWAFNDPESKSNLTHFRKVKTMSFRYFYELCTAKVIITNYRTTDLFIKREKQYYIQTWHSSLRLKQIEEDAENVLPISYVQMAKKDSVKCDLLLSGCRFSSAIFRSSFWYQGEIFEQGTPRNDVFFHNIKRKRNEVLSNLKIPLESKILLYAPTFRKNENLEVYNLDFGQLQEKLEKRFGGEWIVLVKLHPHLISKSSRLIYGDRVIDATLYDDIQELLVASDILISDYSSLIFDYALTKRPCFLYVPDMKEYTDQDRNLYFNMMDLPFLNATSNQELMAKIDSFNSKNYKQDLARFLKLVGSFEKGNASELLLKRIEDVCFGKERGSLDEAV